MNVSEKNSDRFADIKRVSEFLIIRMISSQVETLMGIEPVSGWTGKHSYADRIMSIIYSRVGFTSREF